MGSPPRPEPLCCASARIYHLISHTGWRAIMAEVKTQQVPLVDGLCGTTFHDPEYEEVDVEVWLPAQLGAEVRSPSFRAERFSRRS